MPGFEGLRCVTIFGGWILNLKHRQLLSTPKRKYPLGNQHIPFSRYFWVDDFPKFPFRWDMGPDPFPEPRIFGFHLTRSSLQGTDTFISHLLGKFGKSSTQTYQLGGDMLVPRRVTQILGGGWPNIFVLFTPKLGKMKPFWLLFFYIVGGWWKTTH